MERVVDEQPKRYKRTFAAKRSVSCTRASLSPGNGNENPPGAGTRLPRANIVLPGRGETGRNLRNAKRTNGTLRGRLCHPFSKRSVVPRFFVVTPVDEIVEETAADHRVG